MSILNNRVLELRKIWRSAVKENINLNDVFLRNEKLLYRMIFI